jgi:hypothetical protein
MTAPASLLDAPAAPRVATVDGTWNLVRHAAAWSGRLVLAACCVFVFIRLQPHLIFRNTTAAGGDMGAHVWWPAYLRDHLLGQGRIAGWSPDWYAGFPAGQYYFPLPALAIVALDLVLPYNIAFKVVTASGAVLLPVGAYVFARGFRAPRPTAALMAVGATGFLFFKGGGAEEFTQRISGGTLPSLLAGEYSFTIALAAALAFFGTLESSLRTRRHLWLPAVLIAAAVTSHLVVGVFAIAGAVVIWLAHRARIANLGLTAAIGGVGFLLTAIWTIPLVATIGYTNDMGYETVTEYVDYLFPGYLAYLVPFIVVALVAGIWHRRHATIVLAIVTGLMGLVFRYWGGLDVPAWNVRFLPFWYLGGFLLAAIGVAEIVRAVAWALATAAQRGWWDAPIDGDLEVAGDADALDAPPAASRGAGPARTLRVATIAVLTLSLATIGLVRVYQTRGFVDFWAKWNYTGYEDAEGESGLAKSYPEYRALIDTMDELPDGRALWEPSSDIGDYGTTLALMLLPYFTDGRIGSMEGLYYEASATTPYHFMAVATLTAAGKASNPVRGIPYRTIEDFDLGVRYLQLLGVRYFVAQSSEAKQRAETHPDLELVATSPDFDTQPPNGWSVYEVANADLVTPLRNEPVVVDDEGDWRDDVGVPWFNDPKQLDTVVVADGPDVWARADADELADVSSDRLDPVEVTDIEEGDDSISFHVSRTGVPVLVKTSYFPNWRAEGADGPYRATPNFMVVVPTSTDVRLEYGTTSAEWLGRLGTVAGLVGVGLLVWWPRRRRSPDPSQGSPTGENIEDSSGPVESAALP